MKEGEMRAIAEDEFGGPVTLMDLPTPEIGAGEVLIRVRAAGVNPFDWKVADGILKDEKEHRFPMILGFDAAGVVERLGPDVSGLSEGDGVYGYLSKPVMGEGTYAEYVGVPAAVVARKPQAVGFAEAAALPMPGLTAMDLLDAVDLQESETVLVVGATGGVGSYATQLAARRGARVIATARRENEAFARELGAAQTIDHTREDPVQTVRAAHPDGIEAVIDVVSDGEALGRIAGLLKQDGRLASSVFAADVEGLARRGIRATNVSMQPDARRLEELSWMVEDGELSVRLEHTFQLESTRGTGKKQGRARAGEDRTSRRLKGASWEIGAKGDEHDMQTKAYSRETPATYEQLVTRAGSVLRRNDMGDWTRAAPGLYPHQWSWDSAFIAIGFAHLDTRRAAKELLSLFRHQWRTGKVPHIVFNPQAPPGSYFPGPEHWTCAAASPDAPPAPPYTSCLCQPPIHAIAALRVWEVAERNGGEEAGAARDFLRKIYPGLLRWHRYLLTYRDPEGSGLVTIYHPWESGTDNSPRWDTALAAIEVGDLQPYPRYDLLHVANPSQRPTDADYDRYLWLVSLIKKASCDERSIYRSHPFLVKDVLFSAILVAANEALLEIAGLVGAQDEDRAVIADWIDRGRRGLETCWDPELGLCLDHDLQTGKPLRVRTVAGFAPLIAGRQSPEQLEALIAALDSPAFLGHPWLRWPVPPSTSPFQEGFHRRSYWRGPTWPVVNWLLWWSLLRAGKPEWAGRLRQASLQQIASSGLGEYFDPFTGELLGATDQSWSAAVALDWLANGPTREERKVA